MSRPVFVIGSGRSGTTLFYRLLISHRDFAWVSRLSDRVPWVPQLALLSRIPGARRLRPLEPSVESPRTLAYCGLSQSRLREVQRPLRAEDLPAQTSQRLTRVVTGHRRWMRRRTFAMKSTANTMRVGCLTAIFPEAYFIHIVRHPCGVANSLLRVNWWPELPLWWLDITPREWEAEGNDPYELCVLHWRQQVQAALDARRTVAQDHYIQLRYEDFVRSPVDTLERVASNLDLTSDPNYTRALSELSVDSSRAWKWQDQLPPHAQERIVELAQPLFSELSYAKNISTDR